MNRSRYRILIPFSRSVALSRITRLFFAIASDSCFSISITLHCASTIICTSMDYYTSIYTSMNGCTFASTMFSSPTSIYIVCASTKCYSTHSDDILGARMLWKPKEARILKNFIDQPV